VFDKDGKVISGPPPRPLSQYEVKIENDDLFILGG
jgi:Rieske Fe-S protein